MKKKALNYFLITAVVIVWGLITYRVIAAYSDSEPDEPASPQSKKKEAYNDYTVPIDTAKLRLDYRDPFGIVKFKDTAVTKLQMSETHQVSETHRKAVQQPAAMNWNFIRYVGYIRNPVSKKLVAVLSLNNSELMMNEGEQNGDLKLIRNFGDSIKINYQGKMKFIQLKPATL